MTANKLIQDVYEQVLKRNPGEVEFHQAVKEVLETFGPGAREASGIHRGRDS